MIRELPSAARDLWRVFLEEDETERIATARIAFRLVHLANITAVTSPVQRPLQHRSGAEARGRGRQAVGSADMQAYRHD